VAFHNASIRDFVIRRLGNDRRLAKELLRHVCFFEQIAILMQLQTKGELDYSADGIINDGAELRDAIRGCLTTRSPVVYQYQRMSLGGRLSAIGKWAVAKERKSLTEFACRLLRRMMAAGAGEELTVEVTGFLEALLTFQGQSAKHQKLIRQIIITIGGSMDERAEVESVETWGRFLKTWRRELRGVDVTTMKSRVVGFFEAEAESILKTNDTAEDVRFWARDLKQVADIWGVNIRPITKNLRNAAREYPRRKKTKLDQYKRDRSSATGADADNAIDRLFSSLARRESEPQIQANR
jgi:hypothetical protein